MACPVLVRTDGKQSHILQLAKKNKYSYNIREHIFPKQTFWIEAREISVHKVILHADLNHFYAAVSCLKKPDLRELPVAVCGNPTIRHGIVLAKNTAAKRFGVRTGQVIWQARQNCPDLNILTPDYEAVLEYSQRVRDIFSRYTDHVQPFGVDEAWLDVSGPEVTIAKGERIANHIRHTVREETGLTISVGVSDNRVFAKLGSDMKKPDAVSVVCEENRKTVLDPLPIGELLFIGRATARKLNSIGIYTVGQLAAAHPEVLHALLGKNGLMLYGFAHGSDASPVIATAEDSKVKSVGNSITTAHDMTTCADARITLYGLSESVASRLRKHRLVGRTVQLSVRNADLQTWQRQCTLNASSACSVDFFDAAYGLLLQNWREGISLRLLGISVSRLSAADEVMQLSFLPEDAVRQKWEILEHTIDGIRSRYGHFAIQRAIMLSDDALGDLNPEEEHVLHPEPYFK